MRGERLIKNAPGAGVASCDLERAIARQDNAERYRQARCGGARRHLTEARRRSVMRRPPCTSTSDRKTLGKLPNARQMSPTDLPVRLHATRG